MAQPPERWDVGTPVVVLRVHHGSLGIARSLGRLGVPVHAVYADPSDPGLASRYWSGRHPWDFAGSEPSETVDFLLGLGHRLARPAVLIPTSDDTAELVAAHIPILREPFLFQENSVDLVRALSHKSDLHALAREHRIPTPNTVFPRSLTDVREFGAGAGFPVMLKASEGLRLQARTGKRMVIIRSAEDLERQYVALEDPANPTLMLQEYIPGGDDTIWMFNGYFDRSSDCVVGITGKKLRQYPVHTGATSLGICLSNPTVHELTTRFMKAIGYRGILDIGFRFDARDGSYKLLDPNPRIGSSFRLFVTRAGHDVARYLYGDLTAQPLPPAEGREGRRWLVEDQDLESCLDYRREGQLTLLEWIRSYRGVEEAAWFAWDDRAPFFRMMRRLAGKTWRFGSQRLSRSVGPRDRRNGGGVSRRAQVGATVGGLAFGAGIHRVLLRRKAAVAVFHRIDDRYPTDPITLPTEEFRRYCEHFARHYRVVSLSRLVEMLSGGEDLTRSLAISFDDGYRDNHAVAAPILQSLGLPACFFVTTGFIETETVPWWDRDQGIRSEWMSWQEVRDLHDRGFEIGAHTVSHADLGTLEGEAARRGIQGSKEELERRLGAPATLFAYPFGRRRQITEENRELVRRSGFACCASAFGGTVRPSDDPFHLRRLPVTRWYRSPAHFGLEVLRA